MIFYMHKYRKILIFQRNRQLLAISCQISLIILKQWFLLFISLCLFKNTKVSINVRPLQQVPAIDDFSGRILQKLSFRKRVIHDLMQLQAHLKHLRVKFLPRIFLISQIILVIFLIKIESFDFKFGSLAITLKIFQVFVFFHCRVEEITLVPARAVLFPITQTNITEMLATLSADHVVAAFVAHDTCLTFWARLSKRIYKVFCIGVHLLFRWVFFIPSRH